MDRAEVGKEGVVDVLNKVGENEGKSLEAGFVKASKVMD